MNRRLTLAFAAAMLLTAAPVSVKLRSRVEAFKGSGQWQPVEYAYELRPERTAVIICDMWDKHWCRGATERVAALATRMQPFLDRARAAGILIIHAPSETMEFYKDAPQRLALLGL